MGSDVTTTSALKDIATLFSPQFSMPYPDIVHRDLISPESFQAMDFVWKIGCFAEKDITIKEVSDVFLVEEGLVFTRDGLLVEQTITQHSASEIARGREAVKKAVVAADSRVLHGSFVLCKKRGAHNYGHWLCEMLPKAQLVKTIRSSDYLRYITPEISGALGKVIVDSLSSLQVLESCVVGLGSEVVRVERLIIVDGLTSHGQFMSPIVMNCVDAVSTSVKGRNLDKLFVLRTSSQSRRFVNEEQILARALASGYTLINPGEMDLIEQVAAFKNARHIVGVMGAEMTNLAFASRGARATLLAPASMSDTFFWFISGLRGICYQEIRCAQIGPQKGFALWDTDLILNPRDLDTIFDA